MLLLKVYRETWKPFERLENNEIEMNVNEYNKVKLLIIEYIFKITSVIGLISSTATGSGSGRFNQNKGILVSPGTKDDVIIDVISLALTFNYILERPVNYRQFIVANSGITAV